MVIPITRPSVLRNAGIAVARATIVAACIAPACGYSAGSFSSSAGSFPGARTTIRCLDIAASLTRATGKHGDVVAYTVGNRCDAPAVVDFAALRARSIDGALMQAFDPQRELRALRMEARTVIVETIEYRRNLQEPNRRQRKPGICVDVGPLDGSSTARWLCHGNVGAPGETQHPLSVVELAR